MKDLCSTRMQRLPGNIGILPRTGTTKSGISYPFLPIAHIPPGQLGAGLGFWWQSWLEWPLCSQTFWVIQLPCGLTLTGSVKKPGYVKQLSHQSLQKPKLKKKKATQTKSFCSSTLGRCLFGCRFRRGSHACCPQVCRTEVAELPLDPGHRSHRHLNGPTGNRGF